MKDKNIFDIYYDMFREVFWKDSPNFFSKWKKSTREILGSFIENSG